MLDETKTTTSRSVTALDGLTPLALDDLARYKAAVDAGQQIGWGYYFPWLLARNQTRRKSVFVTQDEGSICVFQQKPQQNGTRLDLMLAPAPMNVSVLRRCLERANDHNGDVSARVMRIDAGDVDAASDIAELRIKPRKSQYLYDPRSFAELAGNRYRTFRRNVALVESLPDVEVLPFSNAHVQECHELMKRWRRQHKKVHGTLGGSGSARRAIDIAASFDTTDLRGEVVFIAGRLSGFSLGGEIRPGVACYLEARNDFDIPGLSYFLRRSFLSKLNEFDLVNDGSDTGRAGLRQLKQSLRPIAMHTEYRGVQRSR